MTTTRIQDRPAEAPEAPSLRLVLVGLLAFIGLGGLFGGINMLADPYRPMGMTTHMIQRTPFDTFVWPGGLLLVLVGVVPLFLAVAFLTRVHPHPGWVVAFGVGLMAWIVTQWLVVDARLWLQPAILAIGLGIVALGALLWRRSS